MSAPKQAYKSKSIVINGIRHNCTKLQVSEATHKSRFYLDGYVSSGEGIVGFVEIGGENANMHNLTKRGGTGRAMHGGKMVRMLNDGGLNTKGVVLSFSIDPQVGNKTAKTNNISYRSAYYLDSNTNYGIRYRLGLGSWQTIYSEDFLAKNGETTQVFNFPVLPANISMEVYAFISNEEGEYRTDAMIVLIDNEPTMMSYNLTPQHFLCSAIKDTPIYYDGTEITQGTRFYTNSAMTIPAEAGGYSDGEWYYNYGSNGVITRVSCATPPVRNTFQFSSSEPTKTATCMLDGVSGALYFDENSISVGVVMYKTNNPIDMNTADAGFYGYYDGSVKKVIQINNSGVITLMENC